jgi:hypothetical protein
MRRLVVMSVNGEGHERGDGDDARHKKQHVAVCVFGHGVGLGVGFAAGSATGWLPIDPLPSLARAKRRRESLAGAMRPLSDYPTDSNGQGQGIVALR